MERSMLMKYRTVVEQGVQPAVRLSRRDLLQIIDDALFGHTAVGEYSLLESRLVFLLDQYELWSEEGTFTFPDGETFYRAID